MIHLEETGLVQFLVDFRSQLQITKDCQNITTKVFFDISMKNDNGTPRDVDDFLLRPNITKRIEEGSLKSEDEESINKFCSEFITDPEYVKNI